MTATRSPPSLANSYSLVYDAWNRLVEVTDGLSTVAKYKYDGRNYRIVKCVYAGGVLDHDEHYYYNEGWQVLKCSKCGVMRRRPRTSSTSGTPTRSTPWPCSQGDCT